MTLNYFILQIDRSLKKMTTGNETNTTTIQDPVMLEQMGQYMRFWNDENDKTDWIDMRSSDTIEMNNKYRFFQIRIDYNPRYGTPIPQKEFTYIGPKENQL